MSASLRGAHRSQCRRIRRQTIQPSTGNPPFICSSIPAPAILLRTFIINTLLALFMRQCGHRRHTPTLLHPFRPSKRRRLLLPCSTTIHTNNSASLLHKPTPCACLAATPMIQPPDAQFSADILTFGAISWTGRLHLFLKSFASQTLLRHPRIFLPSCPTFFASCHSRSSLSSPSARNPDKTLHR